MDDYLHITLTDEQDVPDALARLRVIYPNLMRLDYDNLRTRKIRRSPHRSAPRASHRWNTSRRSTSCRTISR